MEVLVVILKCLILGTTCAFSVYNYITLEKEYGNIRRGEYDAVFLSDIKSLSELNSFPDAEETYTLIKYEEAEELGILSKAHKNLNLNWTR